MINDFLTLGIALAVSLLVKELFNFLKLPTVVGQLLAGLILGLPFIQPLLFNSTNIPTLEFLSNLGILFLLFLAGLELDINKLREASRDGALIATSSAAIPFVLGFLFLMFLGYSTTASVIFGISLALTSEATKTKVLFDLGKLSSKLGAVMVTAGTFDDLIEVFAIALVLALAQPSGLSQIGLIPVHIIIFLISIAIISYLAGKVISYAAKRDTEVELFSVLVVFLFITAALSEFLGLGFLIGAIISGFVLQISLRQVERVEKEDINQAIKLLTMALVVPFFFINVGLKLDLASIGSSPTLLMGAPLIAIAGTIIGTIAIKPLTKLTMKQLYLVGWAMNSRGSVELVVGLSALSLGLIPLEVFSAIAVTSLVSTFIFPFILQREILKDPGVMEGPGTLERLFSWVKPNL